MKTVHERMVMSTKYALLQLARIHKLPLPWTPGD